MTLKHWLNGTFQAAKVDTYWNSHETLRENNDQGLGYFYSRIGKGMILYGLHENIIFNLSRQITENMVRICAEVGDRVGVKYPEATMMRVVKEFNGFLPISIRAISDGTWVPRGTPFAEITNTEKGFENLVTFGEDLFMRAWFGTGCMTRAFHARRYLDKEGLPRNHYHNMALRSYPSDECAYFGDTAWNCAGLTGTDGFESAIHTPHVQVGSIPAASHATMQNHTTEEGAYKHNIDEFAKTPNKVGAYPIDTYNADRYVNTLAASMFRYAADKGVTLTARPDSGKVFTQARTMLEIAKARNLTNARAVISDKVTFEKGIIYDKALRGFGLDPANVYYGIGKEYHNGLTRDTFGFAFKMAYSNYRDVAKFASGKKSLAGRLELAHVGNRLKVFTAEEFIDAIRSPDVREKLPSAYHVLYEHNSNMENPYFSPFDIKSVSENVDYWAAIPNLQQKVDMSLAVIRRTKEVGARYV